MAVVTSRLFLFMCAVKQAHFDRLYIVAVHTLYEQSSEFVNCDKSSPPV